MTEIANIFGKTIDIWKDCTKCNIGSQAHKHVFGRGSMPCDIMFIGEGPGRLEDIIGKPFVGLSGQLLDKAIKTAIIQSDEHPEIFFTNLICCRPVNGSNENRIPTPKEIKNCMPRLIRTIQIMKPKIIITLGKIPQNYLIPEWKSIKQFYGIKVIPLPHPSWILRQGGERSLAFTGFVQKLKDIFTGRIR